MYMVKNLLINLIITLVISISFIKIALAESLNLKLECKSKSIGIHFSNGTFEQMPNDIFFVKVEVRKLKKPIKGLTEILGDLNEEVVVNVSGHNELYTPTIRTPIGMAKNPNLGFSTLDDETITILGAQTKNPDFKWVLSLNRYNGIINIVGNYKGKKGNHHIVMKNIEGDCSIAKKKF
jgi:hypothetical protein